MLEVQPLSSRAVAGHALVLAIGDRVGGPGPAVPRLAERALG